MHTLSIASLSPLDIDLEELMGEVPIPQSRRKKIIQDAEAMVRETRKHAVRVVSTGHIHALMNVQRFQEIDGMREFTDWAMRFMATPLHLVVLAGEPVSRSPLEAKTLAERARAEILEREVLAVFSFESKAELRKLEENAVAFMKSVGDDVSLILVSA